MRQIKRNIFIRRRLPEWARALLLAAVAWLVLLALPMQW